MVISESDFRRTIAELHESHERLRATCRRGVVTFRWDFPTNRIAWKGDASLLFGSGPLDATESFDDFLGRVHPNDRPAVAAAYQECRHGGAHVDVEFRVVWADGQVQWIDDTAGASIDGSGVVRCVIGACVNVTLRKEIETFARLATARIRQIDQLNDEFVKKLTEELRAPVTSILGWTQVLQQGQEPADYARGLQAIERDARLQARLINDLPHSSPVWGGRLHRE